MSQFKFKLEPILNIRRGRRDQCRQIMAEILRRDAELVAEKERVIQMRLEQLQQLRDLNAGGEVNIDAAAARRFFAGQLTATLAHLDRQRELVAGQLDLCRKALIKADQDVKAIENMKDKQQEEFQYAQEKKTQRELEDGWAATHRVEVSSC